MKKCRKKAFPRRNCEKGNEENEGKESIVMWESKECVL